MRHGTLVPRQRIRHKGQLRPLQRYIVRAIDKLWTQQRTVGEVIGERGEGSCHTIAGGDQHELIVVLRQIAVGLYDAYRAAETCRTGDIELAV